VDWPWSTEPAVARRRRLGCAELLDKAELFNKVVGI